MKSNISKGRMKTKDKIILYSIITSFVMIIIGIILCILFSNLILLFYFLLLGILIIFMPYFVYRYIYFLELRNCERNLPIFLNDLKEAKASGVSFPDAVKACRGNYGKLSKYVDKLKKDVSWGISIDDALKYMKRNLKDNKVLSRSLTVLHETYRSGGNIEEILETLINSLLKLMESENYKKAIMQQHVFLMYGIFLMYAALVIVLGSFLLPFISDLSSSETSLQGFNIIKATSPCDPSSCIDDFCKSLCGYYNSVGLTFGFGEAGSISIYYKSLFFTMITLQGFFTGIIAGQISSRSWLDSIKHGLIMLFLGFFIIIFANTVGFF